jgi:ribosomal-protein-serine acetyltransferase
MAFFIHDLGDGATLEPIAVAHAEELLATVEANRERLAKWEPWARLDQNLAGQREFLRGQQAKVSADTAIPCLIRVDGTCAGTIELRYERGNGVGEIGYWIAAEFEGRGIVRRATEALIDHAFGAMGFARVELYIVDTNERSRGLAERLGFTHEGTRRRAHQLGDERHDLCVYGLLAEERAAAK